MRIRKLYNGTGPTGDPKKKGNQFVGNSVAMPSAALNYLSNQNYEQAQRMVDAIEAGEDVLYDPALAPAVNELRAERQKTRSLRPVDYTGRAESVAPVGEFLSPLGDLLAVGEGVGLAAQGIKERDPSKVGLGAGLSLGAVGMALIPGNLNTMRAFADQADNRAFYHIADAIEDSHRAGTDLTPEDLIQQLEARRYSPEELVDAAEQIDRFVGLSGDYYNLSAEERRNLTQLSHLMDPEGTMLPDDLMESGFYQEADRLVQDLPMSSQNQLDNLEAELDNIRNSQFSYGDQQDMMNEITGEISEILTNQYGSFDQIPTEVRSRYGLATEGASAQSPTGRQNFPMSFRGEDVDLPRNISHFELHDSTRPSDYGPVRTINYQSPLTGDKIEMYMMPIQESVRTRRFPEEWTGAYPDSYMAKIDYADTRRGKKAAAELAELERGLKIMREDPNVSRNDIAAIEERIEDLKEGGVTTSRDTYAMMTKMIDQIQSGDLINPGSLSTDSYGLWLRQIDKGNKYLTKGGPRQGAKLIPADKIPRERTIPFQPLNMMGEFTNIFRLPDEMLSVFKEFDMLTSSGAGGNKLRDKMIRENGSVDDYNKLMREAKEKYIDPELKKRGLPPSKLVAHGNSDRVSYPGTEDPLMFEFPLPFLEKLYRGGKINLVKKQKKGMRVNRIS